MTVKQFLLYGGVILLVLGVFGFSNFSIGGVGGSLWFDSAENWAHTILGLLAIALALYTPGSFQRPAVWVIGLIAVYFAVAGFMAVAAGKSDPNVLGITNMETIDNILHTIIAVWALAAAAVKTRPM